MFGKFLTSSPRELQASSSFTPPSPLPEESWFSDKSRMEWSVITMHNNRSEYSDLVACFHGICELPSHTPSTPLASANSQPWRSVHLGSLQLLFSYRGIRSLGHPTELNSGSFYCTWFCLMPAHWLSCAWLGLAGFGIFILPLVLFCVCSCLQVHDGCLTPHRYCPFLELFILDTWKFRHGWCNARVASLQSWWWCNPPCSLMAPLITGLRSIYHILPDWWLPWAATGWCLGLNDINHQRSAQIPQCTLRAFPTMASVLYNEP